jgi:hypothetical protein
MQAARVAVKLALCAVGVPGLLAAIQLQSDTLKAWNDYIQNADSNIRTRQDGRQPFLWADEDSERLPRLKRGEILVAPVTGRGIESIANGLIHDWIGAVFIPKATISGLLSVVHDYDRYKDVYRPVVADSKLLACTDAAQKFSMVWRKRVLFVTAVIEGQYEARDFTAGARRGYNIANTTQIQEIGDYRQTGEHLLPPGEGNGFIWRLHSIAKYEERDGGVYLELEAIALTRDIPAGLRWMVSPVVNHLSINSMATSLRETRDAVNSLGWREGFASCSFPARGVAMSKPRGVN